MLCRYCCFDLRLFSLDTGLGICACVRVVVEISETIGLFDGIGGLRVAVDALGWNVQGHVSVECGDFSSCPKGR
jgi:hypothetical protein